MPTTSIGTNNDPPNGHPSARSRIKRSRRSPEIPRAAQQTPLSIDRPLAASMHGAPCPVAPGAKRVSVRWTLPPGHNKDLIVQGQGRAATQARQEKNVKPSKTLARPLQVTKAANEPSPVGNEGGSSPLPG